MKLNISQRTPEWLALRRTKIGASDIPVIMGTSPWGSIEDLVQKKRTDKEGFTSKAMQHGTNSELHVLGLVAAELGKEVLLDQTHAHDTDECAMASLDGITADGLTVIEVKAPGEKSHTVHKTTGIPIYYYQQMQWQMYNSNTREGVFASWFEGDLYLENIEYDQDMVDQIIPKAHEFYNKYIAGSEIFEGKEGALFVPDEIWAKEQLAYLDIQEKKKPYLEALRSLEEEENSLKCVILDLAQDKDIAGSYLKVSIFERKGSIDEDKLVKSGVNVNAFRKRPTIIRKISPV